MRACIAPTLVPSRNRVVDDPTRGHEGVTTRFVQNCWGRTGYGRRVKDGNSGPGNSYYGDTQWYFSTTVPSLPSDTDHASVSRASLFSNHNRSTHGDWHFNEAYRKNGCSGSSRTDGWPNCVITKLAGSPTLIASYAVRRFIPTYALVATYDIGTTIISRTASGRQPMRIWLSSQCPALSQISPVLSNDP